MDRQPRKVCEEVKTNAHHTDYSRFCNFKWSCAKVPPRSPREVEGAV